MTVIFLDIIPIVAVYGLLIGINNILAQDYFC